MSLFNDVLEPFRRVINTDPPKDKLSASTKLNFSDSNQSLKEGIWIRIIFVTYKNFCKCAFVHINKILKFIGLSNLLSAKRKSTLGPPETITPEKRPRTETTSNIAAVPPSPWEAKRLKIDLIAAKAQVYKTVYINVMNIIILMKFSLCWNWFFWKDDNNLTL